MDDRSAMQVQLGDEAEFVKFAEYFVYRMQALWRTKEGLPFEAFIDIADKVEEQVYKKALIENHPVPQGIDQDTHVVRDACLFRLDYPYSHGCEEDSPLG